MKIIERRSRFTRMAQGCAGCGFVILLGAGYLVFGFTSHEETLRDPLSFESVKIRNSGWLGLRRTQSITILLAEGAPLDGTVDLSIFGNLRPGMDHREAVEVEGPPRVKFSDNEGQTWYVFEPDGVRILVGCPCDGSDDWYEDCIWRLQAELLDEFISDFLGPDVDSLLEDARQQEDAVLYRELSITAGDGESISSFLDRADGELSSAYWLPKQSKDRYGECGAAVR